MVAHRTTGPASERAVFGAWSTEAVRPATASHSKSGMAVFETNQPITTLGNERTRWRIQDS